MVCVSVCIYTYVCGVCVSMSIYVCVYVLCVSVCVCLYERLSLDAIAILCYNFYGSSDKVIIWDDGVH